MYNNIDLCLRFYVTFSPLEAEIILYLNNKKEHSCIGTYSDFTKELGRNGSAAKGDASNIRKAILRLVEKNYITISDIIVEEKNKKHKKSTQHCFKLIDNFEEQLAAQDFNVQQLRYRKINK